MSENTLDDLGRATLESIAGRRVALETLAAEREASRDDLEARLAQLVDNGLIREVDGRYEATENGERLLRATPVGARDDRIDTPETVERAIEGFDCRPDEASALRGAFSFLRYWGEATTAEVVDATYSEWPAGYESADRWWCECVRDRLEALPGVRREDDDVLGERWTVEGDAAVDTSGPDGRSVPDPEDAPPAVGSARHALESRPLEAADRRAVRRAFATLAARGRATTADLLEPIPDDAADAETFPDRLTDSLEAIPGVSRAVDADGETAWTYDVDDRDEGPQPSR